MKATPLKTCINISAEKGEKKKEPKRSHDENGEPAGKCKLGCGFPKGHPEPEKASTELKILPLLIGSSTRVFRQSLGFTLINVASPLHAPGSVPSLRRDESSPWFWVA